jgi:hypothetical protein
MQGRNPKPTHLKLLDGNPGRRRPNSSEPEPTRRAPTCPSRRQKQSGSGWQRSLSCSARSAARRRLGLHPKHINPVWSGSQRHFRAAGWRRMIKSPDDHQVYHGIRANPADKAPLISFANWVWCKPKKGETHPVPDLPGWWNVRASRQSWSSRPTRTCCGTPAASPWPTKGTTPDRCKPTSATRISNTRKTGSELSRNRRAVVCDAQEAGFDPLEHSSFKRREIALRYKRLYDAGTALKRRDEIAVPHVICAVLVGLPL